MKPAKALAADLEVRVEPPSLALAPGKAGLVTVVVTNRAAQADTVALQGAGSGLRFTPAQHQVALAPGESATRHFEVVSDTAGERALTVRVTSALGADLAPLSSVRAAPPIVPQAHGPVPTPAPSRTPAAVSPDQGTPALPILAVGAALLGLAFVRRRLK